jgi:1,4-alpha-glucan branching enzyme
MGWMHDTLSYFSRDPVHRRFHHDRITFRRMYAFTENFVLALSHDEVVHGKGSLLSKMAGDDWQKFANLRLLLAYMYGQPGKKLLFMGGELGQWREWNHDRSLDWHLLRDPRHAGLQRCVRELNRLYRDEPALHERDHDPAGFQWIDCADADKSVVSFLRRGRATRDLFLVACNFTPIPRTNYRLGAPRGGFWEERMNTDGADYGGAGWGNLGGAEASPTAAHGQSWSLTVTLPPLGAVMLKSAGSGS